MEKSEPVTKPEERALDRLILFSDAVVAIAITLLVLPLTDLKPDEGQGVLAFLGTEADEIVAFFISFLVIARFWTAHHAMFKNLVRTDKTLMMINTGWLASVVLLPFPTALLNERGGYASLYLLNLLATSGFTTALGAYIARHPRLVEDAAASAAERRTSRFFGLAVTGTIVLAFIASLFWEGNAMLLLLLMPIVQQVVNRLTRNQPVDD